MIIIIYVFGKFSVNYLVADPARVRKYGLFLAQPFNILTTRYKCEPHCLLSQYLYLMSLHVLLFKAVGFLPVPFYHRLENAKHTELVALMCISYSTLR